MMPNDTAPQHPLAWTPDELHSVAGQNGGRCLAAGHVTGSTNVEWECAAGHRWFTTPDGVRRGAWCSVCGEMGQRERLLAEARRTAELRGGRYLDAAQPGQRCHLQWECAQGHRWIARPENIQRGRWCQQCADQRRRAAYLDEARRIAGVRGGRCLSTSCTNSSTKLQWQCADGHRWSAPLARVKTLARCAVRARKRIPLLGELPTESLARAVAANCGLCLPGSDAEDDSLQSFECANGHRWQTRAERILDGDWCPQCAR